MIRRAAPFRPVSHHTNKGKRGETVNGRNLEQVCVFRRYLLEKADRSGSRLMRAQILRWVERGDAARFDGRVCSDHDLFEKIHDKA